MSSVTPLVFGLAGVDADAQPRFEALAEWMRTNAGLELTQKTMKRYEDLVLSVREGSCDVAWLPPVVYARIAEGVSPVGCIVREGKTSYSSALVVDAKSSVAAPVDLRGKRAGWVDPWSAAGFVVPRLELARVRLDPRRMFATERFFGQHKEALLALSRGECDVVATFARTPDVDAPTQTGGWSGLEGVDVRVIATYGPIPSDVIAVRRNLDPKSYELVASAFREASGDVMARPLLADVFNGDTLREGTDPGHEALRLAYERGVADGLFD